ncbi:MAG TPA: carboxypeptidase M32 [Thermomicrobiales bacterium]
MEQAFQELKRRLGEIHALYNAAGLLVWDQQTMMPKKGAAARGEHLAALSRLAHERLTDPEIGRLLDELRPYEESLPYDSDEASMIRVARRDWEKARRVPPELAAELARAAAEGYTVWVEAREANDFQRFLPALERNIELKRRYIEAINKEGKPAYDVLLDDYEQDLTAAEVTAVFTPLRDGLVPLVATVRERADRVDDAIMHGSFPADRQKELLLKLIPPMGYDPESWRLDPTHHPFAQSIATTDIRLTTRYDEEKLTMALFGTIHELGHGLYEAGSDPALEHTILAGGASMALHESQSRLWENVIGRGRPFWDYAFPILRDAFPEQFGRANADTVWRAVNKMQPSLIRTEADELTYPLHIILRFELERDLFEGDLRPADLPEVWNAKMEHYLGVTPPNDALGVMQDVHWSEGLFGYFPTYALGTVLSLQIWERLQHDLPGTETQIAQGQFGEIREWLRQNLYRHGRKFPPKEMIKRLTGDSIKPEPFLRYITDKVQQLYAA